MSSRRGSSVPRRKPVPQPAQAQTGSTVPATWNATPYIFLVVTAIATFAFAWPMRWIVSGAPILFGSILLGHSKGHRILPSIPLWTIFTTLNLVYAISSTSWLLYTPFAVTCYTAIFFTCLFQFDYAAGLARSALRRLLHDLHFINDKVAFFDLPALEIDGEVNGLFSIRGVTLSLPTMTLVAHGVEVGIKLSEDMELAIQVDKVTVRLLRRIDIDDVYANVKGGDWEMTFGTLAPEDLHSDEDAFIVSDTPILRAAAGMALDGSTPTPVRRTKTGMTDGKVPKESSSLDEILKSVKQLSPDEKVASKEYEEMIQHITETSSITMAKKTLREASDKDELEHHLDFDNMNDLRAAICTHIHDQPSIPHPPPKSIRLSTLKKTSHPEIKAFIHRLPLLYRMLLSPICYFHPVNIKSITAAGSGKWFKYLMQQYFFKHYTQDADVRKLENRISAWLADANFAVELGAIHATAQFPITTTYDIETHFKIKDVMAYRTLPGGVDLKQVVRVGGADAAITLPVYLFPRHEHLLPAKPTEFDQMKLQQEIDDNEGAPQAVQAQTALEQLLKDEANMNISVHAHLPARFHQDLLNFTAAIVKASKVIETDKDWEEVKSLRELKRASTQLSDSEVSSIASTGTAGTTGTSTSTLDASDLNGEKKSIKTFLRKVDTGFKEAGTTMRDGMRKAGLNTASAMANDRWIAKLVGKITRKLEKAQGDLGYSGNIPLPLQPYRDKAEPATKLLP